LLARARRGAAMARHEREVEVGGHIVDSMTLSRVFDTVMDMGGEFEVLEIEIGRRKGDESRARLLVSAPTAAGLEGILEQVYRHGAAPREPGDAALRAARRDMVMPAGFYSTTNSRTQVRVRGRWVEVDGMMMDKCIVVRGRRASCVPPRLLRRGDMVVVGEEGVRVTPPQRPREGVNVFEFMGSSSSSERPTRHIARRVAEDIVATKARGGRIVLVGGPAIVHTGAADAVAGMVRGGLIDAVLAGNALAVHDIEHATMGTSLGMNVSDGTLAVRGHRNHMDAVNAAFGAGSFARMVSSGRLRSGIVYECVRARVPLVLAASIRDDGPLPGVITDMVEAQREYRRALRGADMVIMVATMLHSIATGNMLPADVKVVVIDISQPTVTKLIDRGTWQALGVVTDVGAFLPLVAEEASRMRRGPSRRRGASRSRPGAR